MPLRKKVIFTRDFTPTPEVFDFSSFSATSSVKDLISAIGGRSFNNGLFRIVAGEQFVAWNERVEYAFPRFIDQLECFAYDWLGRAFALGNGSNNERVVLIFEPGSGEALETPFDVPQFITSEVYEQSEVILASQVHHDWIESGGATPSSSECIGFIVPLFLGGGDELSNLEVSDIDVYWNLCGQLLRQVGA